MRKRQMDAIKAAIQILIQTKDNITIQDIMDIANSRLSDEDQIMNKKTAKILLANVLDRSK